MDKKYEPLFTPWKIRNLEIKNRIVMTSMGGTSIFGWMEPNHFDKEAANFLLERAKNNVGLILPGIAPVKDPMFGRWLYKNEGKFEKLAAFMEEFHKTGCKLFVQITAGFGRSLAVSHLMEMIHCNPVLRVLAKPVIDVGYNSAAPSPNPNRWSDKVPSREITLKEMSDIVDGFARTARLCMQAGVDGIEVHAVHEGYLLDQFTLKYANQRTDNYGGSFENRYRFPVEIVQAIKKSCGDGYPVSLRYSVVSKTKGFRQGALPGEEFTEVGRDMEESEKAAKYLQECGYDMLNCDNGTYDAWYWSHPPSYMPRNCNLDDVMHIKKFVDIPVVCAGLMEPDAAAAAISEGKLDGLGIARQFLADPAWVTKLMDGQEDDILPCIRCHNACFNFCHYEGVANDQHLPDLNGMSRCAVNPETMQTKKYRIKPAARAKRVAVIGGGIGGMACARVAALRGHKVTLYEKSDELGGVFIAAAAPDFKEKDKALIAWYRKQISKLPIDVKCGKIVLDPGSLDADEIVIATGAAPKKLPVEGFDKAIEAVDYLLGKCGTGENVVVVGGSLTGCEVAYDLYNKGKKPVIVEMKNDLIAVSGVCLANSSYLREFFALNKVPVYLNTTLSEVTDDGIKATGKDGKTIVIKADSVIMAVGYDPAPLAKKGGKIHLVGDCKDVGSLRTVTWNAWDVAMKL